MVKGGVVHWSSLAFGLHVNLLCTTGKTYSMFGEGAGNSRGMIPRCMEEVFAQLDRKAKVKFE